MKLKVLFLGFSASCSRLLRAAPAPRLRRSGRLVHHNKILLILPGYSLKERLNFNFKTKFNSIIEDFYLTSVVTKASNIMIECSKSLIKESSNFNSFSK